MEDAFKIQEEFESLIIQLERLRNINALTSENAENSKLVISEVEKVIKSTFELINKLEDDFNLKREAIEGLIGELNNSVQNLNNHSEIMQKGLNVSLVELKTDISNKLSVLDDSLKESLGTIQKMINISEKTLTATTENLNTQLGQVIKESFDSFRQLYKDEAKVLKATIQNQEKEIKALQTILFIVGGMVVIGTFLTILILK